MGRISWGLGGYLGRVSWLSREGFRGVGGVIGEGLRGATWGQSYGKGDLGRASRGVGGVIWGGLHAADSSSN